MLKLNKKTDADILAKLDETENKQGYIKHLIREDIKRTGPKFSVALQIDDKLQLLDK